METGPPGWVWRWQGTKNKSGSMDVVYLKHTMRPALLIPWNALPGGQSCLRLLIQDHPYWGLGPSNRQGSLSFFPFLFGTVCHTTSYIFSLTDSELTPTKSFSPEPGVWSSGSQHQDPGSPKGQYPPTQSKDLLRFGMCVQEALILGNN